MGVVPFNVRTYGGKTKLAITLEQKVCAQSPTYTWFITSFPMYWHLIRTLLLPLAFENGAHTPLARLTDKLTTVTRLRMRGEG